jgi:hypothetical protein
VQQSSPHGFVHGTMQFPPEHVEPPEHTTPQPPQLFGSLLRFAHEPPHTVKPPAH